MQNRPALHRIRQPFRSDRNTVLLVGLAVGLLRGNLSSAVTAAGAALALVTLPSIINAIFTV